MTGLIFGANGQDGYYLKELLKSQRVSIVGVSRSGPWIHGDVTDFAQVEELVKTYRPDYVFHLAANSSTRHEAAFENHETVASGTLNVLEAVYRHCWNARVFIPGSGVQFAKTTDRISEHRSFDPSSPYAASRIYAVNLARYYRNLGVKTYVGYLFHHESPLRQPCHISKKIVNAVRTIAKGNREPLCLGDLAVVKEWTFAGDVVRAMMTLVEQDDVFEAVIGSGIGYSIRTWLEICFDYIGKDWTEFVRVDNDFVPEYKRLVSDPARIFSLGWRPTVDIGELAEKMLTSDN